MNIKKKKVGDERVGSPEKEKGAKGVSQTLKHYCKRDYVEVSEADYRKLFLWGGSQLSILFLCGIIYWVGMVFLSKCLAVLATGTLILHCWKLWKIIPSQCKEECCCCDRAYQPFYACLAWMLLPSIAVIGVICTRVG